MPQDPKYKKHRWYKRSAWKGRKTGQFKCKNCNVICWTLYALGAESVAVKFYQLIADGAEWTTRKLDCSDINGNNSPEYRELT